ncbi:hypothetical protein ACIBVL_31915 [Streptomyces sp. NPDC049687]|uniref:hypothetical protein n=1 Tax=Streptomyces sp. NPDC049687 TaxID=3365596 RepID=UPI0037B65938
MITPADDFDDGAESAELDPEDPLTVILRPAHGHLAPPPGRYAEVRRGAARRRLLRTAAGAGVACAVAALAVLLPGTHGGPATPTVPLAPPSNRYTPTAPTAPDTAAPSDATPAPTLSSASDDSALPIPSEGAPTGDVPAATDAASPAPSTTGSILEDQRTIESTKSSTRR